MITIDEKTNSLCGNVYLLDERLCLGDSFALMNSNFQSLSAKITELSAFAVKMNDIYTTFAQVSATWNTGADNANKNTDNYNNTYTTMKANSASWAKEFGVTYPYIFQLSDWNANTAARKVEMLNWLHVNFVPQNFPPDQIIYLNLNLYQTDTFSFSFGGSFQERCDLVGQTSVTVSCDGNAIPHLVGQCNIHRPRVAFCYNPFTHVVLYQGYIGNRQVSVGEVLPGGCGQIPPSTARASGNCKTRGGKLMSVQTTTTTYNDTYTARCLLFKYQKQSNERWLLI